MKISRRVVGADGAAKKEEKVLTINVKPGWKSGTKITFQREGDQAPNKIPADIIFIIRDKPHQHFKREGSDLKHQCKITLREVNFKKIFIQAKCATCLTVGIHRISCFSLHPVFNRISNSVSGLTRYLA